MQTIAAPPILPAFARLVAVPTDATGDWGVGVGPWELNLPERIQAATLKRQREFIAGRYCAAQALRLAGAADWAAEIGTGPAGEPLWPAGFVGSITHTVSRAASAVAGCDDAVSIGIDAEPFAGPERVTRISGIVLHACESRLKARGFGPEAVFTLCFSAKEAFFKCLFPVVRRRFDYRDAAIRTIDVPEQQIEIELLTSLGAGYHRGRRITGRFDVGAGVVSTGFCIPRGKS
jgi:enterobactin synthetase component D